MSPHLLSMSPFATQLLIPFLPFLFPPMFSYRYDTATSAWTIDAPEDREGLLSGMGMGGGTGPGTGLATNSADLHEGDDRLDTFC